MRYKISNLQADVDALSLAFRDDKQIDQMQESMTAEKGNLIFDRLQKLGVIPEPKEEPEVTGRKRLNTVAKKELLIELD